MGKLNNYRRLNRELLKLCSEYSTYLIYGHGTLTPTKSELQKRFSKIQLYHKKTIDDCLGTDIIDKKHRPYFWQRAFKRIENWFIEDSLANCLLKAFLVYLIIQLLSMIIVLSTLDFLRIY